MRPEAGGEEGALGNRQRVLERTCQLGHPYYAGQTQETGKHVQNYRRFRSRCPHDQREQRAQVTGTSESEDGLPPRVLQQRTADYGSQSRGDAERGHHVTDPVNAYHTSDVAL